MEVGRLPSQLLAMMAASNPPPMPIIVYIIRLMSASIRSSLLTISRRHSCSSPGRCSTLTTISLISVVISSTHVSILSASSMCLGLHHIVIQNICRAGQAYPSVRKDFDHHRPPIQMGRERIGRLLTGAVAALSMGFLLRVVGQEVQRWMARGGG